MPRARVELVGGPRTYFYKGRRFKRGEAQIITTSHEIEYYRTTNGFAVTYLSKGEEKVPVVKKKQKIYSEETLTEFKKKKLQTIAARLSIPTTGTEKKAELVDAILLAQE